MKHLPKPKMEISESFTSVTIEKELKIQIEKVMSRSDTWASFIRKLWTHYKNNPPVKKADGESGV